MAEYPYIQGKRPGSWNEVYFATALDKFEIGYQYQVVIIQQFGLRGSIVVDFVIYNPFQQPVEIFGEYWHEGAAEPEDALKLELERQRFGREPIVIWGSEIDSQEKANDYVQRNLL